MTKEQCKKLLDVNEASSFLKTTSSSLYKLTSQQLIPHLKLNRRVLFCEDQLQEWLLMHAKEINVSTENLTNHEK